MKNSKKNQIFPSFMKQMAKILNSARSILMWKSVDLSTLRFQIIDLI